MKHDVLTSIHERGNRFFIVGTLVSDNFFISFTLLQILKTFLIYEQSLPIHPSL